MNVCTLCPTLSQTHVSWKESQEQSEPKVSLKGFEYFFLSFFFTLLSGLSPSSPGTVGLKDALWEESPRLGTSQKSSTTRLMSPRNGGDVPPPSPRRTTPGPFWDGES